MIATHIVPGSILLALVLAACGNGGDENAEVVTRPPSLSLLVLDAETGKPISGVHAAIQDKHGVRKNNMGKTDDEGRFDFGLLEEGLYVVIAGDRRGGYVPEVERVDLESPTEVVLELRTFKGFGVKVVPPEGVPMPDRVKVYYRKAGRNVRPVTQILLDEEGRGHTWMLVPDSYEMEFVIRGFRPIKRQVTLPHEGIPPVRLELVPE